MHPQGDAAGASGTGGSLSLYSLKPAAAAHCVSLNQAPPDCPRSPEPARRPSSLCYLCRPACSASLQGGTVQAIMSATVPPGLCESSQAHSGAFVFIIPGLPSVPLLIPFPAERPLRALSLMPGRAMPRRWALRLRAGDCVSPRPRGKPPDDEPQGGRTGEAQSSGEPPCLNHPGTVPARPWHAVRISLRCRAPGHRAAPRAAERAPAA